MLFGKQFLQIVIDGCLPLEKNRVQSVSGFARNLGRLAPCQSIYEKHEQLQASFSFFAVPLLLITNNPIREHCSQAMFD